MEWTLEAFFADGGTTKFVDRLAGALGIHASTIKVVSVYEGSVVINYVINVDDDDQDELDAIQATQTSLFATNTIDLGAPILDVTTGNNDAVATKIIADGVVTAAGYDQIVVTEYTPSSGGIPDSFSPDLPESGTIPDLPDSKQSSETVQVSAASSTPDKTVGERIENAFEGQDETATIIIIVTVAAFVLICVVVAVRLAMLRSKKNLTDVQNIAKRREEEMKAK